MAYDLKSLKVPRLAGRALKTLVKLIENKVSQKALLPPLLKEAGIEKLRALEIQEPLTLHPQWESPKRVKKADVDQSLKILEYQKI